MKGPCLTFNPGGHCQAQKSSEQNKHTIKTLEVHIYLLFNFVTFFVYLYVYLDNYFLTLQIDGLSLNY